MFVVVQNFSLLPVSRGDVLVNTEMTIGQWWAEWVPLATRNSLTEHSGTTASLFATQKTPCNNFYTLDAILSVSFQVNFLSFIFLST
jgi:hypothetical protein